MFFRSLEQFIRTLTVKGQDSFFLNTFLRIHIFILLLEVSQTLLRTSNWDVETYKNKLENDFFNESKCMYILKSKLTRNLKNIEDIEYRFNHISNWIPLLVKRKLSCGTTTIVLSLNVHTVCPRRIFTTTRYLMAKCTF